jgi:hypothetical protein
MSDKPIKRKLTRRDFVGIAAGAAGAAAVTGLKMPVALAAGPKPKFDAPTITCGGSSEVSINIQVCAGASGAPAGFSIQWMTCADYAVWGWPTNSDCPPDINGNPTCAPSFCKASFSGNAFGSRYNLTASDGCGNGGTDEVTVNIGEFLFDNGASTNCPDALQCGTCYVFRAFAHANSSKNRSDFTTNLQCSTLDCRCPEPPNCTYTQGYWKNHGLGDCHAGNNDDTWPDLTGQCTCTGGDGLCLGSVCYTKDQLCTILNTPAGGSNQTIALEHQLIAAKLNILKGADGTDAAQCIADADAAIAAGTTSGLGDLIDCLRDYNEGKTGPGHCC